MGAVLRSYPGAGQFPLGSGAGRIRHLRNSLFNESRFRGRCRRLSLGRYHRRKNEPSQQQRPLLGRQNFASQQSSLT